MQRSHYFLGNDPSRWRVSVRSYQEILYRDLYPGIDLVYRATTAGLKYEFRVAPGASPRAIEASFTGIETLDLSESGLIARTPMGEIRDSVPIAFQDTGHSVRCRFVLRGPVSYGFDCEGRDAGSTLTIDPLVYATFLGGTLFDYGLAVVVDPSGNAYVAGATTSFDFPATAGSFSVGLNGVGDAFVAKFDATGALKFATYLGGTTETYTDIATSLSLDATGNIYVTGETNATDFPVTPGAFQTTFNRSAPCRGITNECTDGFIAKLSADGASLRWATYLGGSDSERVWSLKVDSLGNVFVAGGTWSRNFPISPGAFRTLHGENEDAFVTKLRSDGSSVIWSTFLGDTAPGPGNVDEAQAVALGDNGTVYVGGETSSADFPVTPGAFDTTQNGSSDAWIAKLTSDGSSLIWSTFLGGGGWERYTSLVVDAAGTPYVAGQTNSSDFPVTTGAFDTTLKGGSAVFVTKLVSNGTSLTWSTLLGGSVWQGDGATSLAVDASGSAYVTAETNSPDFPVTPGALDTSLKGSTDAFFTRFTADGSALVYSTFLGGSGSDLGLGLALGANGTVVLTGYTNSSDFPVTPGAFDTSLNGPWDAFVVKLDARAPDLEVSSGNLSFAPPSPIAAGTPVSIRATVHNVGDRNASDVWVRFHDGPPSGSNRIGTDQLIPRIAAYGGTGVVAVAWPAGPPGVHEICVVADPANNITESNETNNEACAPLEVLSLPDYVLVDPRPPGPIVVALSLPVSLAVGLRNRGGSAPNATSTLAFVSASMPSSPFSTVSVPPVPAGGTAGPFTVTWTSPASPGTYAVFASADYRNNITESNETNNNITWTINVVTGPTSTLVVGTPNVTATTTYVTSTTPLSFSLLDPNGMGIRRTSYRIDGGTWVNYTATGGFTLTPGGERLLEWFSDDYAGNVESVRSARLRVDDTPPSTSIAVGSPKYLGAELYVTSTTSISLIAVDGGATPVGLARTEYRVDGGAWAQYASSVILMGVDGLKAIDYRSADLLGNMETVRALRVVLDNTAPQTAISPSAPPFPAGAYFTLSATDAGSGVSRAESRIDGGRWIRYMSFMVPEGTHAIGYRSVDNLGNVETERTLNVTVEMVVPVEPNQKPLVALAFSIILFAAGAWSSRRAPWKGEKGKRATLKALVVLTLPFVALEVGTGVVSLLTGVLSVPPVLGLGMAVDGTILVAGIAMLVYRAGDQQGA